MSGNHEKIIDIPACPICNKKPLFWILFFGQDTDDGWIWLFSDSFLGRNGNRYYNKLHKGFIREDTPMTLNSIVTVACREDNGESYCERHTFTLEHPIFKRVIRCAANYWDKIGPRYVRD